MTQRCRRNLNLTQGVRRIEPQRFAHIDVFGYVQATFAGLELRYERLRASKPIRQLHLCDAKAFPSDSKAMTHFDVAGGVEATQTLRLAGKRTAVSNPFRDNPNQDNLLPTAPRKR